jgi:hypothetical protein
MVTGCVSLPDKEEVTWFKSMQANALVRPAEPDQGFDQDHTVAFACQLRSSA